MFTATQTQLPAQPRPTLLECTAGQCPRGCRTGCSPERSPSTQLLPPSSLLWLCSKEKTGNIQCPESWAESTAVILCKSLRLSNSVGRPCKVCKYSSILSRAEKRTRKKRVIFTCKLKKGSENWLQWDTNALLRYHGGLKNCNRIALGESQADGGQRKTLRTSFKFRESFYTFKWINLQRQPELLKYL